MPELPNLDVWVTDGCRSCARTLRAVGDCAALRELVAVKVRKIGDPDESPPDSVIGGPATVFQGTVIALGTPDCSALVERILSLMKSVAVGGGS